MIWLRGRLSWEVEKVTENTRLIRKVFKHGDTLIWMRERQLHNELHSSQTLSTSERMLSYRHSAHMGQRIDEHNQVLLWCVDTYNFGVDRSF